MAVEMKKCEKCGAFYNAANGGKCSFCSGDATGVSATQPVYTEMAGKTEPVNATQGIEKTMAMSATSAGSGEKTCALIKMKTGIDPVVGWLVCKSGAEKGRDYKIHSENNYIGRSENMDICIHGDTTISRENHAIISYDDRERIFYFTPGEGRSIVRLNGKALLMTSEIKAYDEIEIGTTILVFIPLCGETFQWE